MTCAEAARRANVVRATSPCGIAVLEGYVGFLAQARPTDWYDWLGDALLASWRAKEFDSLRFEPIDRHVSFGLGHETEMWATVCATGLVKCGPVCPPLPEVLLGNAESEDPGAAQ